MLYRTHPRSCHSRLAVSYRANEIPDRGYTCRFAGTNEVDQIGS
jgi:hypothetical protein